ncbi:MAG TPA: cytochrome C oxidase subunit II [Acidobacteriaceae bacterium]
MPASLRTGWLPPDGSLHGPQLDRLLESNLAVLLALLLLAQLLLLYGVLRSRRGVDAAHPAVEARTSAWRTETLPLLLCCLLFAAMAISSQRLWAALRYQGPAPGAMQVEAVGVQFQWYFRYPGPDGRFGFVRPALVNAAAGNPLGLDPNDRRSGDDIVSSVLVLPAGREVDLRLRAHDVIHGFFIPGMRLKQNAVPGLLLHVHFTPVVGGTYPILCTQVCGSGHARMQAVLHVVPPGEFATWLAGRERALTPAAEEGARQ